MGLWRREGGRELGRKVRWKWGFEDGKLLKCAGIDRVFAGVVIEMDIAIELVTKTQSLAYVCQTVSKTLML